MRVAVIGETGRDDFAENMLDCLPDLGVEAVPLGPAKQPSTTKLAKAKAAIGSAVDAVDGWLQRGLVKRALDAECDVIITVEGRTLLPETVARLRSGGAKVVLWFPDHLANLNQRLLAAPYDRVFFKDPELVRRMADTYQSPVSYLPEACNPRWHRPIGEPGSDPAVAVVGNLYGTRVQLLDRLHADQVLLRLWGSGWPRVTADVPVRQLPVQPPVHREAKARVFRQAAGVLNNLHPAELSGVNCRLFEATGSGGAVLCEDRPALRDLFDVGTEVLAFSTYEQLLGHVRRLADDPELTRKIGDAATARAHAEHTYQHRLRSLLEAVA